MPQLPDRTNKPHPLFAMATGLFLVTVLPAAGPASAQSFDCQKAYYPDEKTICQDSRLGQLDQELASAYGRWVAKLPKERREEIQANETLFVQARRRCGHNRDCIEQSYRNRIEEIQGARAEEDRGRPDRARASESRRRSTEREPLAGGQATGAPARRHPPNRATPATVSGTASKEPTPAVSQPVPESGSTGWVNPPPSAER